MSGTVRAAALPEQTVPTAAEPAQFVRTSSPLQIDGRLEEASWVTAPAVTRFFELYPTNLGQPRASTDVRFLYDDRHVYIGVRAYDPDPAAIRAPLVKRDHVGGDQDYAEILLDPMNTRRSAMVFRANARGVAMDALFNEDTQSLNPLPDFDFDVRTSRDSAGWSAEFRIPLTTLRYEAGDARSWAYMLVRGYPRSDNMRISSAPIPRGANCQLCFAAEVGGISLPSTSVPLALTPHAAYYRNEVESREMKNQVERLRAGFDVRWQPQPDSIVDLTVRPDFSQVEADAVQLTANARFTLFVPEKRPFFLESADLPSTPISAVYTRSLTEPEVGARMTHRGDGHDFTVLVARDAGGGSVIEPGVTTSQIVAQDFESNAFVGRYQLSLPDTTLGALGSARINDDGSDNTVLGADAVWSPSSSDRLTAQILWTQTRNPDRPDLVPDWTGQHLAGSATNIRWEHRRERWYATATHERLSPEFRAWNGFEPQVGITRLTAGGGYNFYPDGSLLTRVSPVTFFTRTDEAAGGERVDGNLTAGFELQGARGTSLTLTWQRDRERAMSDLVELDSVSMALSASPAAWLPAINLNAARGDALDRASGQIGVSTTLSTSGRLRLFQRFDFDATFSRQQVDSQADENLLTNTAMQATATWHFSNRLYAQALVQRSTVTRSALEASPEQYFSGRFASLLVSFQTNWRKRFHIGLSDGSSALRNLPLSRSAQRQAFAKFTYAFSMTGASPFQALRGSGHLANSQVSDTASR